MMPRHWILFVLVPVIGVAVWFVREERAPALEDSERKGDAIGQSRPAVPSLQMLPSIENPPDDYCRDMLSRSLETADAAAKASAEVLSKRSPSRQNPAFSDEGWEHIPREKGFLRAFLSESPGLPLAWLHRAPDLNPADEYVPQDIRSLIEAALGQYSRALADLGKRRDEARVQEVAEAVRMGPGLAPLPGAGPGQAVSISLVPGDVGRATTVSKEKGLIQSATVDAAKLARYRYLDSLYWFIAREFGCQVVATYSALGYLPSGGAEAMTARICLVCEQRSGS